MCETCLEMSQIANCCPAWCEKNACEISLGLLIFHDILGAES